jgi:cell division protease FtsH
VVLLGGRAAEQIVFGHLSTGAADDLQKVTDIARAMVVRYGMSARLGHVAYEGDRRSFLNPAEATPREHGDATQVAIDEEVRALVEAAFERSLALLRERRAYLDRTAEALLQRETLDEREIAALTEGMERQAPVAAE